MMTCMVTIGFLIHIHCLMLHHIRYIIQCDRAHDTFGVNDVRLQFSNGPFHHHVFFVIVNKTSKTIILASEAKCEIPFRVLGVTKLCDAQDLLLCHRESLFLH